MHAGTADIAEIVVILQRTAAKFGRIHRSFPVEPTPQCPYNARARNDERVVGMRQRMTVISGTVKYPPVYRITLAQVAILVLLSLLCWLLVGQLQAVSLLGGGLVAILPQAWFAARVFRWRGAQATAAIARSALAGEVGKFILSMAGFAAIFVLLRPVDGAAVLGGYVAMVAIQITGSWLLLR